MQIKRLFITNQSGNDAKRTTSSAERRKKGTEQNSPLLALFSNRLNDQVGLVDETVGTVEDGVDSIKGRPL